MKLIDIAICVDNIDPKGMGRIRCVRYSDYVGEKEGAYDYNKWSEIDPFIASPFLPININFIPEIGQAIKIINYDTDKETVNQEYIAGPFTTSFNFNQQKFSNQLENTTYGATYKISPNIISENGEYINKKSNNVFANKEDFAIYGKNGTDILFTKDGITLRAGKLENNSLKIKNDLTFPLLSNNISKLHLKKYEKTLYLVELTTKETKIENRLLNYIVEYEIDSLTLPCNINFYVYSIIDDNDLFNTNTFNLTTDKPNVKLITNKNTFTKRIEINDLDNVVSLIRSTLFNIYDKGLSDFNISDLFPFYFRPTKEFLALIPINNTQKTLKDNILNKVSLLRVGPNNGLIWSNNETKPPTITLSNNDIKLKISDDKPQTFASITSDNLFLLSNNTNNNKIDFNILEKYEYSQENYIKNIKPNTYSIVRGEKLIEILKGMLKVLFNHRHNLTKPMVKIGYDEYDALIELIKDMEEEILNKSIRIN